MKRYTQNLLLPKVIKAVEPLIREKDFKLELIEFGDFYRELRLQLVSTNIILVFSLHGAYVGNMSCYLTHIPSKKQFVLKYLIPAINLNIQILADHGDLTIKNVPGTDDTDEDIRIFHNNIQKVRFLERVNQICIEIKRELPALYQHFDDKKIDETYRRYLQQKGNNLL